ncbi:MAG: Hsp70 family protein [Verrucomicrobiales bacterium]|nr:Hsp70 family protein [Verrucomicrobiales bacterium]
MAILGIDLGTTNSLIGAVDSGFPILLANAEGHRSTPSAIHFPDSGDPVVGEAALRQRALSADRVVTSVKRLMGKRLSEVERDRHPYPLTADNEGYVRVALGNKGSLSPEEISALILKELKASAEAAMGTTMDRAVITVPAYFNDAQRQATKRAGGLAGLTVERIVNEPTAAALAFGLHRSKDHAKIAVYDLGGGTFDISILEIHDGVFHVLSTNGDTYLGGDDIDHAISEHLWQAYQSNQFTLAEQDATLQIKFRAEAEAAKIALSEASSQLIRMPFVEDDKHFEYTLTRETLDQLARPIVERTKALCLRALHDAKLKLDQLDEVLLVGGSTRMPLVRQFVTDLFQQEANTSQHPDETVAMGAVIQGGILSGTLRNIVLLDVTPLSLGIESFGGLMNVIIPRNTTIPAKAGEMFTNAVPDQTSMLVRVLQGEREMARDNWELGQVEVPFTPGPKGSARIGVQFQIDENGILEVLTRDTKTNTDTVLEVKNAAVDVDDKRVEAMISESVDHAFDDMSERVFTEAKLKSEELLPAVDQALALIGDQLDNTDRQEIQDATEAVKQALANRDATELKQANAKLDDATQQLAALLMQKALADASA